jgi:hypothetical protein
MRQGVGEDAGQRLAVLMVHARIPFIGSAQ